MDVFKSDFPPSKSIPDRADNWWWHRRQCYDCMGMTDEYMVRQVVWREAFPNYGKIKNAFVRKARVSIGLPNTGCLSKEERQPVLKQQVPSLNLCFRCLENRLGRQLVIEDFTDAPINRPILLGYRIRRISKDLKGTRKPLPQSSGEGGAYGHGS